MAPSPAPDLMALAGPDRGLQLDGAFVWLGLEGVAPTFYFVGEAEGREAGRTEGPTVSGAGSESSV